MKLDRIKFAVLVSYVTSLQPRENIDIPLLDTLTEINVEPVADTRVSIDAVNELLAAINVEGKLIEAIKAYRSLTGAGLKEAKDAIERYRNLKAAVKLPAMLGDK